MKLDRDREEFDRVLSSPPEKLAEERQRFAERRQQSYMQPFEASWREFMQHRGWTPDDIAELPDDWLYAEWGRYVLRGHYHID